MGSVDISTVKENLPIILILAAIFVVEFALTFFPDAVWPRFLPLIFIVGLAVYGFYVLNAPIEEGSIDLRGLGAVLVWLYDAICLGVMLLSMLIGFIAKKIAGK